MTPRHIVKRDIGGLPKIRSLWTHFLNSADLLIYVIDASDKSRYEESKECLERYVDLNLTKKDCSVLILANKMECLVEAFPPNQHQQRTKILKETYEELVELFENSKLKQWLKQQSNVHAGSSLLGEHQKTDFRTGSREGRLKIQLCSAKTGEGINEGLLWFFSSMLMNSRLWSTCKH